MNKLLMSRKCFKSCIENVLVKLLFIIALNSLMVLHSEGTALIVIDFKDR